MEGDLAVEGAITLMNKIGFNLEEGYKPKQDKKSKEGSNEF